MTQFPCRCTVRDLLRASWRGLPLLVAVFTFGTSAPASAQQPCWTGRNGFMGCAILDSLIDVQVTLTQVDTVEGGQILGTVQVANTDSAAHSLDQVEVTFWDQPVPAQTNLARQQSHAIYTTNPIQSQLNLQPGDTVTLAFQLSNSAGVAINGSSVGRILGT